MRFAISLKHRTFFKVKFNIGFKLNCPGIIFPCRYAYPSTASCRSIIDGLLYRLSIKKDILLPAKKYLTIIGGILLYFFLFL